MGRRRLRRLAGLAVAVLATCAVTGCAGLPETSAVIDGRRLDEPANDSIRVIPQSPRDGASQAEIALGFIRAGEDADETRETGRSYLAPASEDLWRWSTEPVTVYDTSDGLKVKQLTPESVQVSTIAVARVSPEGRYDELPVGTTVTATFGLTKVGGEWRIELPRTGFGLWLDSNAFDRLYAARQVNYITPTGRRLVPDIRWFPSGSKMATTLARAQLGPVPDYLTGALLTGVPPNTKLAVNAVPIDAGRAVVNLSASALDADPTQRTAMWAQLFATLAQVSAVQTVSLSVEGTSLELPGGGATVASTTELGFEAVPYPSSASALLRRPDDKIVRIDPRYTPDNVPDKLRADTKPRDGDPVTIPSGWHALSLSVDGSEVAAIGGDLRDLSRWRGADFVEVPKFATDLSRPAYDPSGFLWVGGTDGRGAGRIYAMSTATMDPKAVPRPIDAPWLAGRRVTALTIAPDGARMLVVTTRADGSDPQLGLAGIVRTAEGEPRSVAEPWRQAGPLSLIRDVTWLASDSFAVLGRTTATDPVRPWVGRIGSGLDGVRRRGAVAPEEARLNPVKDARWITSMGGPRGIIVITDEGQVLARAGSTWREVATGTDLLIPGH